MLFLAITTATLFVSPQGSDTNSGASWRQSFASVQHAIDVAGKGPATIRVRGILRSAATINAEGASGLHIIGENRAQLTHATELVGWHEDQFNGASCWSAQVPTGTTPFELFTKGKRADLPRLPKTGFFQFENVPTKRPWNPTSNHATYRPQDLTTLSHPEEVEAVVHQLWVTSRLPVAKLNLADHSFDFSKRSVFQMTDEKTDQPSKYFLENVREAFSQPGQWFWDRLAARIYYLPRPGESLKGFTAEVPNDGVVLALKGCDNIRIENVEFSGSEFRYPADSSGDSQAATSVPAAVELADCHNCLLQKDTVDQSATYGFELTGASHDNRLESCSVTGVGAGGVKIGHGTSATSVVNGRFTHLGNVYASAIGVWIGNSGHNVVSHCLISDTGYSGISVGWTWGYGKSDAVDNRIEDNLIQDLGHGELSDMGGIYTLGVSPGTVIRHNRIDHVRCTYYGGWGIYLDEGTSDVIVEDNLVTDCQTGNFHQHYGQDNQIRNNIFAFAPTVGQAIRTRPENHTSFTMEHNIFLWSQTLLLGGDLHGGGIGFNNNLLWKTDGSPLPLPEGKDNLVADPLFANPKKGDFRLSSNSPALKIGFRPFALKGFGPE